MTGPRDYSVATERALYRLATCYAPQCDIPSTVFIEDEPFSNLEIAHIHGAHPGSPRYRDDMTDDERRAFTNLLLLCRAHHELVDRRRPGDHPASLLREWKETREATLAPERNLLSGITETQLGSMLEEVMRRVPVERRVAVDILAGVLTPETGGVLTGPFAEGFSAVLDANPSLSGHANRKVVVLRLRNLGALTVSLQSIDLHVSVDWADGSVAPPAMTMMGRNDFPYLNPTLPIRVEDGDAATWLVATSTADLMLAAFDRANQAPATIYGEFTLATGESTRTDEVAVSSYRMAFGPDQGDA